MMKQDKVHALVVQDPFGMGYKAVSSLVSKIDGKTPPRRVALEPRVITRMDLDKPEVIRLLKPDIAELPLGLCATCSWLKAILAKLNIIAARRPE